MKESTRRYVFLEFEDLKRVKFRKLEKVCDRMFVFINREEKSVPVDLVQKMQRFGNYAKWIVVDGLSEYQNMNYHISFFMGKLHEKTDGLIEFAILSNNEDFDPLVNFINKTGRTCLRVKGKKRSENSQTSSQTSPYSDSKPAVVQNTSRYTLIDEMQSEEELLAFSQTSEPETVQAPVVVPIDYDEMEESTDDIVKSSADDFMIIGNNGYDDSKIINRTAAETVQRLMRSGNRPALVSTLKNYILLHNQELTVHSNIDQIIERMENEKKIDTDEGEVIYHF